MPLVRLPNPCLLAERSELSLDVATEICTAEIKSKFSDERLGVVDPAGAAPVLIYEPIQNVAGMLDLPASYLQYLESLFHELGGLTIADEIFTGLYRFGPLFAHTSKNLSPDIVTFSKGLTNGIAPLSAIWVAEDSGLAEDFNPGTHSCTYLNYELGLAVADRVLDRLEALDMVRLKGIGERLLALIDTKKPTESVQSHFSLGTVARLEFHSSEETIHLSKTLSEARPIGVLHATTGLSKRSIILHPAYTIPDEDINLVAEIVGDTLLVVS